MKQHKIAAGIGQSARGRLKLMVVEDGKVVHERPWQKNLILDLGLNRLGAGTATSNTWSGACLYACLGTGNTPTSDDSGATTASQVGTAVTLSGSLAAVSAGKLIRWDSGEEATVVSGSGTAWVVTPSQTVASGEFTVYRVDQTKLATYVKVSNGYLSGAANTGSSMSANTMIFKRTYEFSAEAGSVNYTEAGFSWLNTANPDLFSRVLFAGGAVTVLAAQQLRVVYELHVTLTPNTPAAITCDIDGWPVGPSVNTDAVQQIQLVGLLGVNNSTGDVAGANGGNDPSSIMSSGGSVLSCGLSPLATAPAAFGTIRSGANTNAVAVAMTLVSYTAGNFFRDRTAVFLANNGNRTDYRSIGFGHFSGNSNVLTNAFDGNGFVVVFSQVQVKDDTHSLTVTFRVSWGRDLS